MQVVDIEPTDVAHDLPNTLVTPVVVLIPNGVAMGTRVPAIVPLFSQLRLSESVNEIDMPEVGMVVR